MKRVWHRYEKWEDLEMWRKVPRETEEIFLKQAIEFTGDHILYGSWMVKVIELWPIACEHNLTNPGMNQKAWLGHAAVQMAIQCPEYITRQAWFKLSEDQRTLANVEAEKGINIWLQRNNHIS